ncbi:FAD-dependent oxidoreductase [Pseudomonas sp. PWP3-1b2]|uniref:FAD-dependent oxidoreductase n=1 Tax=Pseudomonas sp. PWP3-1b2 TaxID=2804656 RepID=UPI003CF62801
MNARYAVDVLICGAGAAGLTLAIDLARRGVRFRLIEKNHQPFHGSRGKGIQPRSQEIFEDLGVLDRLFAMGGVYPTERRYRDDGSYIDADSIEHTAATSSEPYTQPLMVPQFLTEQVLRERLLELGHRPAFGCELVGFEPDADGVSAHLMTDNGPQTLRARWLVGADGGRSFVRHALDIGFPGKTLGVRALVADVQLSGLCADYWHRFGEGDSQRQIMICPLARTGLFQIQAPVPLDADVDLSAGGLAAIVAQRTGRKDIQVHGVSWASAYSMNARLADRYRVGPAFLVGDAAHIHPPTGGQGLNTSVQDAYNLGWKLAAVAGGAPEALLDSYEEERRPVAASVLGLASKLLDNASRGDMRRGKEVFQLDIGYPKSSMTLTQTARDGRVCAGDRAPDARLRGACGASLRLFDMFQGSHWTLLNYGATPGAVSPRPGLQIHHVGPQGDVIDDLGQVQRAYALAAGDLVLVRPDGYIGAIVASDEIQRLEGYLTQAGLTAVMPE